MSKWKLFILHDVGFMEMKLEIQKKDRFFAIGIVGTRDPQKVNQVLKNLRLKTNYFGEVSYKSSDDRRALCSIRWMDWLFSEQSLVDFKIIIKDKEIFNVEYFKENFFKTSAESLAYCQTYREVINNFSDFNPNEKYFTYSQKNLEILKVPEFLEGKITGISRDHCYSGDPKKKKPHSDEFEFSAEMLQLCDLITSSVRGLINSVYSIGENKSWVKRMLQLNLVYHLPSMKHYLLDKKTLYFPSFTKQKFVIFYWKPK